MTKDQRQMNLIANYLAEAFILTNNLANFSTWPLVHNLNKDLQIIVEKYPEIFNRKEV